jgi:hypothetical protein
VKRLELGDFFLLAIALLQLLAVASYAWKRRWHEAVVYGCYMIAQISLILLSIKAR